jgi:D-alanyl-D-alanine carboxypeptidase (penicillin-binding protein 5/6)
LVLGALAAMLILAPASGLAGRRKHAVAPAEGEEEQAGAKSELTAPYAEACVMEPTSGTVIFSKDMHKPWPTASLAKMMVMLIVAEKLHDGSLKLTDQISTSREAARMGGSQVYLKEGETFSLDDMMKAVVVHSANDASLAVAEYVGGSAEAFVVMMNQRAHALGMADTRYYSVHGLPPEHGQQADVASAYDSAILARELIKYPDVLRWSAIDTSGFRNGTFELRNTNHLVRTFRGCDGLKTGFYYKAGFNVVATAKRNGLRLIAVVLGSPRKNQNFSEAATMLSQGFLNYYMDPIGKKGSPISQPLTISGGAVASLKPVWGDDLAVFARHGGEKEAIKLRFDLPQSVAAPIKSGQRVGTGEVIVDGKPAGSAPLIAPADIQRGSLFSRIVGKL